MMTLPLAYDVISWIGADPYNKGNSIWWYLIVCRYGSFLSHLIRLSLAVSVAPFWLSFTLHGSFCYLQSLMFFFYISYVTCPYIHIIKISTMNIHTHPNPNSWSLILDLHPSRLISCEGHVAFGVRLPKVKFWRMELPMLHIPIQKVFEFWVLCKFLNRNEWCCNLFSMADFLLDLGCIEHAEESLATSLNWAQVLFFWKEGFFEIEVTPKRLSN